MKKPINSIIEAAQDLDRENLLAVLRVCPSIKDIMGLRNLLSGPAKDLSFAIFHASSDLSDTSYKEADPYMINDPSTRPNPVEKIQADIAESQKELAQYERLVVLAKQTIKLQMKKLTLIQQVIN